MSTTRLPVPSAAQLGSSIRLRTFPIPFKGVRSGTGRLSVPFRLILDVHAGSIAFWFLGSRLASLDAG